MKRQLLLNVECGDVVCIGCDWHDEKQGNCFLFEISLTDGCVRDDKCRLAEARAKELSDD